MGAPSVTRVPLRASDCFVLALDHLMRRTGQGAHVSQSLLELDGPPDLAKIRAGWARLLVKYPILAATTRRSFRNLLPYWEVPAAPPPEGLPLGLWQEPGAPALKGAQPTGDARARLIELIAHPLTTSGGAPANARLDLAALGDGKFLAALSWSHLLVDGKGAELLLAELGRLCEGLDRPEDSREPERPRRPFWERIRSCRPALDRFGELQETGAPSLGGPGTRAGKGRFEVLKLDPAEAGIVRARAAKLGGALFPVTFYVSCVARAHDLVWRRRGRAPRGYGISVPVQTRKRGAGGPLFHNRVTVLYFNPRRETLGSLEATAAAMKTQFAAMTRGKVSDSFDTLLELMMWAPCRLFMGVVRAQFKGEVCSCFHSHTGPFAPELLRFGGAGVANAYHLAALGTPPGTGIFFGERDERINVTFSWREGAVDAEERRLMIAQLRHDLLGEPAPEVTHAS